ncbi:uncharacterized protein LOC126672670 [Mercurialis annua]|uniref:uncharacterized protein LOC126672670 n=1 Tax=Mercurialis annua TaxID=3986 RepID=UPI00215E8106|nr:uncharacterized protein LOC126672670 [Mercurialis annua]
MVYSTSSSSIRNRQRTDEEVYEYDGGDRYCRCYSNPIARVYTSWTEKNPGRRFYGCRSYKRGGGCDFFEWFEEPMSDRAKTVINGLIPRRSEEAIMNNNFYTWSDEVDSLANEIRSLKIAEERRNVEVISARKKMKIAYTIAAISWLVVVCMVM